MILQGVAGQKVQMGSCEGLQQIGGLSQALRPLAVFWQQSAGPLMCHFVGDRNIDRACDNIGDPDYESHHLRGNPFLWI